MNTLDSMVMPLADALQVELTVIGAGFEGALKRTAEMGSWKIAMGGTVKSVHFTSDAVSCVARIRKSLYMFMVCDESGYRIRAVMFDGSAMGIKDGKVPGSPKMIFAKVKEKAVQWLQFDKPNSKWKTINAFDMD